MAFRNFRLQVFFRIAGLTGTILLTVYLLSATSLYATAAMAASAVVVQLVLLIRFVERTNVDLTRFLEAITYADFSQTFIAKGKGSTFD
ncbi:MAG: ATP-binding protein, partial [Bacteroidetes bacterium]|nr:ATP-binding protein [Bacteroidota bacterium]